MKRRNMILGSIAVLVTLVAAPSLAFAGEASLGSRTLRQGAQGADVAKLQAQLKDVGLFNTEPTGYYGPITQQSVRNFQALRGLSVDGIVGPQTFWALRPQALNWSRVNKMAPVGTIIKVTEPNSGLSYRVKRTGGDVHADVEPLTQWDASVMKRIYGGSWSWGRKAVIVSIKGWRIAASINGMPHGYDSIGNNGFSGHY